MKSENVMLKSPSRTLIAALAIAASTVALAQDSETDKASSDPAVVVSGAVAILEAQMAKPAAERIPLTLRHAARCVAVFPQVIKAGLILAAKHGKGLVSCRHSESGNWGAPAYYNITEASIGLQAGVQNASLMLLVVDDLGVERLLAEKVTFGGDVSVAAGPVGAGKTVNADTSVVSYARTEGVFAGLQLGSSSMSYDKQGNARAYRAELAPRQVLFETQTVPAELVRFQETLMRYAPRAS